MPPAHRPFEAYRQRRAGEAEAAYAAHLELGFPTADFDGQPEPETLQCRSETDRTNWLGLIIKCQAAVAAGAGDLPIDPPIRCTSNRMYAVTHADALARMYDLLGKVGAAQANLWRIKDQIAACERRDDLNLIDLTEGWF